MKTTLGKAMTVCVETVPGSDASVDWGFKGEEPQVLVGIDGPWERVVENLVHELMELHLWSQSCLYRRDNELCHAADGYTVIATHNQFAESCAAIGKILVDILPAIAEEYNKRREETK